MVQGIAFDSNKNEKLIAEVIFSVNRIELFILGQNTFIFSPDQVSFEIGGNNNSLLFLKSAERPDLRLYFEINSDLFAELKKCPPLAKKIEFVQKQTRRDYRATGVMVLGLIALVILGIVYRGPLFGSIGAAIPFGVEKAIADQIFSSRATSEQKAIEERLNQFVAKILVKEDIWRQRLTIHMSSSMEMNAYATIGGHIFVNKGLVQALQSEEQLLGILAHEFQHIKHRHVSRSVAQAVGIFGLIQFILGDLSGMAAVLLDQGGSLAQLQYSRGLEEEADQGALHMMADAQLRSSGLPEALKIIFEYQKKLSSESAVGKMTEKLQKIEILGSHPEIESRIAALREASLATQSYSALELKEFADFKKEVMEKF